MGREGEYDPGESLYLLVRCFKAKEEADRERDTQAEKRACRTSGF